eukprot:CAMPEP_0167748418 /NCGR_PEP_ID=MMETSP0110_2-20121227/4827_1 /TAXON_ID=629695 /ORGANISM="Gymnochlora sp., Strain CCMP2014" /LENGTH=327 /DNA_ID=CAMNT_0007633431 /DNA_START=582 /DNA_END=1562 /DNA_ORIENTATION=-
METDQEQELRIEGMVQEQVSIRARNSLRISGGRFEVPWKVTNETWRRERRHLLRVRQRLEAEGRSKNEVKRLEALAEVMKERKVLHLKEWKDKNEQRKNKRCRMWWEQAKLKHELLAIFTHEKLDPFSTLWRANVLLQTLLLSLLMNGLFYVADDEDEDVGVLLFQAIWIAIISAVIIDVAAIILIRISKLVGYLEWEIYLMKLRAELCERDPGTTCFPDISLAERTRQLKLYQLAGWTFYVTFLAGVSFIILVLGMQFDLNDEERGTGTGFESASVRWITSFVISETTSVAALSPVLILFQALILFGSLTAEAFCLSLLYLFIDDD